MKSNIQKSLNNLKQKDVYSLVLFTLFKLKDTPEYATLSELSYVLDADNLLKFLSLFGGTTIKVPTVSELSTVVYALQLYEQVNISGENFKKALTDIYTGEVSTKDIKNAYYKLCEVLNDYNIVREDSDVETDIV